MIVLELDFATMEQQGELPATLREEPNFHHGHHIPSDQLVLSTVVTSITEMREDPYCESSLLLNGFCFG
jgi:hypothetical protein